MTKNSLMLASASYQMEKDDPASTRDQTFVKKSGWRLSPWILFLILAGAIGIVLSLVLTTTHVLEYVPLSAFIAGMLYCLGLTVTVIVTSGAQSFWITWVMRLLIPLPAAALIWYGLFFLDL